jgi:hypothetical protein
VVSVGAAGHALTAASSASSASSEPWFPPRPSFSPGPPVPRLRWLRWGRRFHRGRRSRVGGVCVRSRRLQRTRFNGGHRWLRRKRGHDGNNGNNDDKKKGGRNAATLLGCVKESFINFGRGRRTNIESAENFVSVEPVEIGFVHANFAAINVHTEVYVIAAL